MAAIADAYFAQEAEATSDKPRRDALDRSVRRIEEMMPVMGLRNPKIGTNSNRWIYCDGADWVMGFQSGQLWLAFQLIGDARFFNAARARRPDFQSVLRNRRLRDHDLGFQFSLHAVADWLSTGDETARTMAIAAATALLERFRPEGGYLQAWSPRGPHDRDQAAFVNGRMIADTMQNLALLHFAHSETGVADFREVAEIHATTTAAHLVRADGTSFHTFVFDPATGEPLRGETHQGYADGSCWARGQAWLIHGFAHCALVTGNPAHLETARRVAAATETMMGPARVPIWDFSLPPGEPRHLDSSAGAIMAAGLYLLAGQVEPLEAERWRAFAGRLIAGLLETCDLTRTPEAEGLLAQGAAHVPAGRFGTMLPYGDYYFLEALMRAEGHIRFFW